MSSWGAIGRFFEDIVKLINPFYGDYDKKDGKHIVTVDILFDEDIPKEYRNPVVVD